MNDFVSYIISLLRGGIKFAALAVVACVFVLLASHFVARKCGRKLPWTNTVLAVIFAAYIAVLLYLTVFRISGYGDINLHLFRAWREAWNGFSLKLWLNVLLNVAMFVPLGFLLPLIFKVFRKWYVMPAVGFAVSLAIESVQYFFGRGLFDVDDLFTNTLGTVLGFCVVMAILSAYQKKGAHQALGYLALPVLSIAFLAGTFAAYNVQEYGNLVEASSFTVNTKSVSWELKCTLNGTETTIATYHTEPFTKETCDEFGYAFFKTIGAEIQDILYYDNETYFMNYSSPAHFLFVYYLDRSYEYKHTDSTDGNWAEFDEATLREKLTGFDIEIPEDTAFSYDGEGWHTFVADAMIDGDKMIDGELRCRVTENGTVERIQNSIVRYEYYKTENIISQSEAYDRLTRGKFSGNETFEYYSPNVVEVLSCSLEYQVDTKGFYQPVYMFELNSPDGTYAAEVMVPALK